MSNISYTKLQNTFNQLKGYIIMSNIEEYDVDDVSVALIGKTLMNDDDNSTSLVIPKEFAKELGIENAKVSMCLLDDCDGDKHLLVTKYHREIVID
jgi:hypothetical protein